MVKHMFSCKNERLYRFFDNPEDVDDVKDGDQFMFVRYPKEGSDSKVIRTASWSIEFANNWYLKNREKDAFTRVDTVCGE